MQPNTNFTPKFKGLILLLVLLASLSFIVYHISVNQRLNVNSKAAADVFELDPNMASQVKILSVSETGASSTRHMLYVSTPDSFAFKPEKIFIESNSGAGLSTELPVTVSNGAYRCWNPEGSDYQGKGFETKWFTEGWGESMDTNMKVIFSDTNGKKYSAVLQLMHSCTILANDFGQVVDPKDFVRDPATPE